jgi:hypothetical protein
VKTLLISLETTPLDILISLETIVSLLVTRCRSGVAEVLIQHSAIERIIKSVEESASVLRSTSAFFAGCMAWDLLSRLVLQSHVRSENLSLSCLIPFLLMFHRNIVAALGSTHSRSHYSLFDVLIRIATESSEEVLFYLNAFPSIESSVLTYITDDLTEQGEHELLDVRNNSPVVKGLTVLKLICSRSARDIKYVLPSR